VCDFGEVDSEDQSVSYPFKAILKTATSILGEWVAILPDCTWPGVCTVNFLFVLVLLLPPFTIKQSIFCPLFDFSGLYTVTQLTFMIHIMIKQSIFLLNFGRCKIVYFGSSLNYSQVTIRITNTYALINHLNFKERIINHVQT
jgi:hypothetical protein